MELEVTWGRAVRVWWAYLWRNLIAIFVAMIAGAVLGFVIGFVLAMAGASKEAVQIVVIPLSVILGLAISVVPMRMILKKDFGEFRVVLVSKQQE